jgi:hypothetical protein
VITLLVLICLDKNCVVVVGSPSGHLVNDWCQPILILRLMVFTMM